MNSTVYHISATLAGPITDEEVNDLLDSGYVGALSDPAIFSRFVETADSFTAYAIAVTDMQRITKDKARIFSVTVMTEEYWDSLEEIFLQERKQEDDKNVC